MIRFGPAAAPRWFNQDPERFRDYCRLIRSHGGSSLELVIYPGEGDRDEGRVHLFEADWAWALAACAEHELAIALHWPLTASWRLATLQADPDRYDRAIDTVARLLNRVAAQQEAAPVLVLHVDAENPQRSLDHAARLISRSPDATWPIAFELRAPTLSDDHRVDRSLPALADFVETAHDRRVGICWDIAHAWEGSCAILRPDARQLASIRHVHVHDSFLDGTHGPLGTGDVPWSDEVAWLRDAGWSGLMALEIRYRYASHFGEPWAVLGESLDAVRTILTEKGT